MAHCRHGTHIAIMAKAPLPGLAKTRLEPALGAAGAAALAERLLRHAVAQAAGAWPGAVTLWAAPDTQHPIFQDLAAAHGVALGVQSQADLGGRMDAVFDHHFGAGAEALLLMGSDIPALDSAVLRAAGAALSSHAVVFVPALDGGYALVGLRQDAEARHPGLRRALFQDMAWSTPQVMAETRRRLDGLGVAAAELGAVPDIDEPADLVHLPAGW